MLKNVFISSVVFINILFSQAIFSKSTTNHSYGFLTSYSKHEKNYNQYNYKFEFTLTLKGKLEFNAGYVMKKERAFEQNNFKRENEFINYGIKYFIHKPIASVGIAVYNENGMNNNIADNITYISLIFSKEYKGKKLTGMNYYPYIQYAIPQSVEYYMLENYSNPRSNRDFHEYISFGCIMTLTDRLFNKKIFVEPFVKYMVLNKDIYSGFKIGLWNKIKKIKHLK